MAVFEHTIFMCGVNYNVGISWNEGIALCSNVYFKIYLLLGSNSQILNDQKSHTCMYRKDTLTLLHCFKYISDKIVSVRFDLELKGSRLLFLVSIQNYATTDGVDFCPYLSFVLAMVIDNSSFLPIWFLDWLYPFCFMPFYTPFLDNSLFQVTVFSCV